MRAGTPPSTSSLRTRSAVFLGLPAVTSSRILPTAASSTPPLSARLIFAFASSARRLSSTSCKAGRVSSAASTNHKVSHPQYHCDESCGRD